MSEPVPNATRMLKDANRTSDYLKLVAHPTRLVILCRLVEGEARVNELESLLGIPQAAVSKQLARLREEGLVNHQRDGRSVIYSLADDRARHVIQTLYEEFCGTE